MEIEGNDFVKTALSAGASLAEPKNVGSTAFALLPNGFGLESLEKFQDAPARIEQSVNLNSLASFSAYVTAFKTDTTVIFADVQSRKLTALLDYHGNGKPSHVGHRAVYQCPHSLEWQAWAAFCDKFKSQEDFALFIEEHQEDVAEPSGAYLLEIAMTLQAKRSVEFNSGVRLNDGTTQLKYVEKTTSQAGGVGGNVIIPNEVKLGIPVFHGGDPYKVITRFRYRIAEGKLVMALDMANREKVVQAAFAEIIENLDQLAVPVFEGEAGR